MHTQNLIPLATLRHARAGRCSSWDVSGCNLSVTNIQGTWRGEGDDMIWVDGYKWPPDLHGTGSEDYLNQAWGMQPNAFLRNGSAIHESNTGGYQTSYIHHLENPVRFEREIKVTIEHGHANHLGNEMASVAYWYAAEPAAATAVPPVEKRRPVRKTEGRWVIPDNLRWPGHAVTINGKVRRKARAAWKAFEAARPMYRKPAGHSPFLGGGWRVSRLMPAAGVTKAGYVGPGKPNPGGENNARVRRAGADAKGVRQVGRAVPGEPLGFCKRLKPAVRPGSSKHARGRRPRRPAPCRRPRAARSG